MSFPCTPSPTIALLFLVLVTCVGCASAPKTGPSAPAHTYLATLGQVAESDARLVAGSEAETEALDRIRHALSDFKATDFAERLHAAYAEEVFFDDTVKIVRGRDAVVHYLTETAARVDETTVTFLDTAQADGNYYLRWRMRVRAPKLADGEPVDTVGMTHLRFDADGRVLLHKDYWDAAGGLYEHLPVVGWLVRRVKSRL